MLWEQLHTCSLLIFICISGAFDDDLSVFAVIMCAALAQQKQLCYKPDIKTKLDACVPLHLGHQCPINTSGQSISLPSLLRSLIKTLGGKQRVWTIQPACKDMGHINPHCGLYSQTIQGRRYSWNSWSEKCAVKVTRGLHSHICLCSSSGLCMKMSHRLRKLCGAQVCGDLLGKPQYHMRRAHLSAPQCTVNAFLYLGLWTARTVPATLYYAKLQETHP